MMTNLGPDLGQLARAFAEAVGIGIIAYLIYERRRLRSRIRQERKRKEMEKKIEEEAFKEEVETDDLDSPEVVETAAAAVAAAYETKNSIRKSLSDVGFSQGQESIWSFGSNNCWERTQEEKGRECGEEEEKEEQAKKKNFTSVDEGESRSSRNDDELKEEGGIVAETFEDNNTMEEEEVAKEKNPDPSSGCNKTSSDEVVMNEEPPVFVVLSEPLDEVDDVGKETGQVKQKDEQVAKETNESRIESCSDDIDTNEANTANEHESIKEEAVEIISDVFKNALDLVEAIALQTEKAGGGSKGDLSNKSVKEETVIAQSDVTADSTIPNGDASTDIVTKRADDLEHGGVIEIDSNREIEEEICCAKLSNSPAEFSQKRSGQEISAEEENAPATSNKSELTTNSSEHVLTEENRDEKSNLESDALQVPPEIQHQPVPQLQDQEPPLGSPKPMPRRRKSRSTITDTRIDSGDRDASAPKEENANATKEDREEEEEKKKQIDAASAALGERIGQLQDALAASESAIADGRLEVVKERSRTSLLKQEMKVQEEICQMKMEQVNII